MKSTSNARKQKQRGATVILFTFMMILVVIPIIGLAIDGSIVMWEKARLVASVDAAALAAGRSLSVALGDADQKAAAGQIADMYFNANFQPGQMGTSVIPNLDGQLPFNLQTSSGSRKVMVARSISVPLYFMRILGFTNTTMEFTGQASRKDVNIILVLDRSGSMGTPNSSDPNGPTACDQMKSSAQTFVNMFVEGRDSLGLVTFQTTANVDFLPSTTFNAGMTQQLNQLVCAGGTNSAWGLSLAYDQIQNRGWKGASNVVVFFSDGYPTAVEYANANALPARNTDADNNDTRYGSVNTSQEYQYAKSPCTTSPISGVLTLPGQSPDPTGYTWGVFVDTQYPINSSDGASSDASHLVSAGCTFNNPPSGYENRGVYFMRRDIAYLPAQDYHGNPTATTLNPLGSHPFQPVVFFPNDGNHIYYGQLRPDVPQNLVNTAFNAADNAAFSIRNNSYYNPIIYSIGLGTAVDDDFMERVANDPRASSYDSNKPAGLYVKAPTSAQLQSAFQQIASQVLRISQ